MIRIHRIYKIPVLLAASSLLFMSHSLCQPVNPQSGKDITVQQWVAESFVRGKVPPFSFRYDGIESKAFIKGWKYSKEKIISADPAIQKSVYSYSDPGTGLSVKCFVTTYSDFPAAEWVVKFINKSGSNTPLIEMAEAIDYSFRFKGDGPFILHHSLGSDARRSDFQPVDDQLQIGSKISMMPSGGRSSDNTALPFFNIEAPGHWC